MYYTGKLYQTGEAAAAEFMQLQSKSPNSPVWLDKDVLTSLCCEHEVALAGEINTYFKNIV